MKKTANIAKRDGAQQLVLTEVFVPNEIDTQGEFVTPATLEKAAHDFNANGNQNNIDVMHNGQRIDAVVVESYIAKKGDPLFKVGSWVVVIKVNDDEIWKAIEAGVLRGVSFEGEALTRETKINGKVAKEMYQLSIDTISLVDRPANRRPFKMTKSDNTDAAAAIAAFAESITKTSEALVEISAKLDQTDLKIQAIATGRPVHKIMADPNADKISYQLRKMGRLQEKLETIWERPDLLDQDGEPDIRRRIAKCQDELFALGHEAAGGDFESHDTFFQNGGTSTFLQAAPSSFDVILGVGHHTRKITKADGPVDNNTMGINEDAYDNLDSVDLNGMVL